MHFLVKLPEPDELISKYPLSLSLLRKKRIFDEQVKNILKGRDNRILMIIGPCSADREEPVIEYMKQLRALQDTVLDCILFIPRLYTSKPRTVGIGYKGLLHHPAIHTEDMYNGIIETRKLHIAVINETEMFCADEMLYPDVTRYTADILAYAAVGARSISNQQHRLTASGLSVPVGMKNPESGVLSILLDAIETAQNPQHFLWQGWEVISEGNMLSHAILRGYSDENGKPRSNYETEQLLALKKEYDKRLLENPTVIIDCNHANSGKDCYRQPMVAESVFASMKEHKELSGFVKGFMVESYLQDGKQSVNGEVYGQSITDPCLGIEKTKRFIYDTANALRS